MAKRTRDVGRLIDQVAADVAQATDRWTKGKPGEKRIEVSDSLLSYRNYMRNSREFEWVPTGNHALDRTMGGGFAVGRVHEMFGRASSGKSLLLHEVMAQVCQRDGLNVLEDSEAALAEDFAGRVGIDWDSMMYSRSDTVEDVFMHFRGAIESVLKRDPERLLCLGWDSLAQTSTRHEMNEPTKSDMSKAKIISAELRRVTRMIGRARSFFVIINQVRNKIGGWGSNDVTPGGEAVPFASSIRLHLAHTTLYKGRKIRITDKRNRVIGTRIVVNCVKNKLAPAYRRCEIIASYNDGILPWSGFADCLADDGLIDRVGDAKLGTFSYKKHKKFSWYEIEDIVKEHPELTLVQTHVGGGSGGGGGTDGYDVGLDEGLDD